MNLKTSGLSNLGARNSWFVFGAMSLTAVLLAIRFLFPVLIDKQDFVTAWAQSELNLPVSFENLQGSWKGWRPTIRLSNFAVHDPSRTSPIISVAKIEVTFSLFRSLLSRRIAPHKLTIIGAKFSIIRDLEGRFSIAGLSSQKANFLNWVFSQRELYFTAPEIEVIDSRVVDTQIISKLNILSFRQGQKTTITGEGYLPSSYGEKFRFNLKPEGNFDLNDFEGEIGLWISKLNPSLFLDMLPFLNKKLINNRLDLACWLGLYTGKIKKITYSLKSQVETNNVMETAPKYDVLINRAYFELSGRISGEPNQWSFDMTAISENRSIRDVGFLSGVSTFGKGGLSSLYVNGKDVPNEFASILDLSYLIDSDKDFQFKDLDGQIDTMTVAWDRDSGDERGMRLVMEASDFEIIPSQYPLTLSGNGFLLEANSKSGNMVFKDQIFKLFKTNFFDSEIVVANLNGDLEWKKSKGGKIVMLSNDLSGTANNTNFELETVIENFMQADSRILLRTIFKSPDANKLKELVPKKILSEGDDRWLRNVFQSSGSVKGELIYDSSLEDFSTKDEDNRFKMEVNVSDATIKLMEDWPVATGVSGNIKIIDDSLEFSPSAGNLENFDLTATTVRVHNIHSPHKRMTLKGDFYGTNSEFLNLAKNVTLDNNATKLLNRIAIGGKIHLNAELNIDLFGEFEQNLKGFVSFNGNPLRARGTNLEIQKLTGKLTFLNGELNGKGLHAIISGKQLILDIKSADVTFLTFYSTTNDHLDGKLVFSQPTGSSSIKAVIKDLNFLGQHLEDTQVLINRTKENWILDVKGSQVSGTIGIPLKYRNPLIKVDLSTLRLKRVDLENERKWNLLNLPALDIKVNSLNYANREVGEFSLKSHSRNDIFYVKELTINGDELEMIGGGKWTSQASNTSCEIEVKGRTLDAILSWFDYNVDGIESGPTTFVFNANWKGMPREFNFAEIVGTLSISSLNGRVLNLEPGTGRLFGLMSLQALPRRLSLDFKDLFRKGLSFDTIDGDFSLGGGIATTKNVILEGPSIIIEISGDTNLVEKSYNQVAKVTPKLSDSIPVASALLGPVGLGAGAVYYLSQKVFKSIPGKVDEILRKEYLIEGSWENPAVTKIER